MATFEIRVIEVENGYVLIEDHPGREYMAGRKWVVETATKLGDLVTTLALTAREEARKSCPEQEKSQVGSWPKK